MKAGGLAVVDCPPNLAGGMKAVEEALKEKVKELAAAGTDDAGRVYCSLSVDVTYMTHSDGAHQRYDIKWRAYASADTPHGLSANGGDCDEVIGQVCAQKKNEAAELRLRAAEMLAKAEKLEGSER